MTTITESYRQMQYKDTHGFYDKYQRPKFSCFKMFIIYLRGILFNLKRKLL